MSRVNIPLPRAFDLTVIVALTPLPSALSTALLMPPVIPVSTLDPTAGQSLIPATLGCHQNS